MAFFWGILPARLEPGKLSPVVRWLSDFVALPEPQ
jgi:hypothetical protein